MAKNFDQKRKARWERNISQTRKVDRLKYELETTHSIEASRMVGEILNMMFRPKSNDDKYIVVFGQKANDDKLNNGTEQNE